ncbi:DUF1579 domain-containing protein [Ciceribacter sp. L1K23]|uniref:DUF1579 domain-containing protein n=1 Tax=Ciceribacter sp. L1K23 TaxID=2820276 RepID=UPI001B81FF04|nr:DUF1579 domain-containing protein [Ciceribacter sp. L1K23]MBR0556398.1 DUF1579 domain-containing protein [Ciceribacter sp. L1K23]
MESSKPRAEHRFLERLVGDWLVTSTNTQSDYDPDDPKKRWTENVRSVGGLWFIAEGGGCMPDGERATMIMTLGYDPSAGQYVGSWIGSMMDKFWIYRGWVEADGQTLTLEAEGPDFDDASKTCVYRDVISFLDDDRRTFSGSVRKEDGRFQTFMTSEMKRVR